jgi:hypothetical protein
MRKLAPAVYSKFKGLMNVSDPDRITRRDLATATNIDIDRTGSILLRDGFEQQLSGDYKDVFSDGTTIIAVKGIDLVRIIPAATYTESVLRYNVGNSDMVYQPIKDKLYYTNGVVIGYVQNNTDNSLATPTIAFKHTLPPGHLMKLHNGVLYIAKEIGYATTTDHWILYSDPYSYERYDEQNDPLSFRSKVIMMESVEDGMYISDRHNIYYMTGKPGKETLKRRIVADYPAIRGTSNVMTDVRIGQDFFRAVVFMSTDKGICVGTDNGVFMNLTERRYLMPSGLTKGCSVIRKGNIDQYITIVR